MDASKGDNNSRFSFQTLSHAGQNLVEKQNARWNNALNMCEVLNWNLVLTSNAHMDSKRFRRNHSRIRVASCRRIHRTYPIVATSKYSSIMKDFQTNFHIFHAHHRSHKYGNSFSFTLFTFDYHASLAPCVAHTRYDSSFISCEIHYPKNTAQRHIRVFMLIWFPFRIAHKARINCARLRHGEEYLKLPTMDIHLDFHAICTRDKLKDRMWCRRTMPPSPPSALLSFVHSGIARMCVLLTQYLMARI